MNPATPRLSFAGASILGRNGNAGIRVHKLQQREAIMKIRNVVLAVLMIALALFIMLPNLSWAAEDGAAIYKAKCASCHGADGAGKPAAKIPAVKGVSLSDAQIADFIVKGDAAKKAPHA